MRCSLGYAPPEAINAHTTRSDLTVEPSLDIWAIGVIVYECLAGCRAFDRHGGVEEVYECAQGLQPYPWERRLEELPEGWRKFRARSIFDSCLQRNPAARPRAEELQQGLLGLRDTVLQECL